MQNEVNRTEEDTVDILEIVRILLKKWHVLIISALAVGIATFFFTKIFITPQYSATSELFVLSKSTTLTSLADIQLSSQLTNDYKIVVSDRPVLDKVISNLKLAEDYESLKEKITLTNPTNSRILYITVKDSDPNRAKLIADEIADVASLFIAEKMDQDPPSILSYGYSDGKKVSPSTAKFTILGAFAGGLVAAIIVLVVCFLNDTISSAEDVERKLGLKLIAQIPIEEEEIDGKKKNKKKKQEGRE